MKPHRHLFQAVVDILTEIFFGDGFADKVLERHFKAQRKWGARDRRFVAEAVYDIVRWWRLLGHLAGLSALPNKNQIWMVLGVWWKRRGEPLPDWNEFAKVPDPLPEASVVAAWPRAVRQSIPDWLDARGFDELGDAWEPSLAALNEVAPVVLRTNTLKTDRLSLQTRLGGEGVHTQPVEDVPEALVLLERKNVFTSAAFKSGWFEMQDASSQRVAPFTQVVPGERVIDACAGAGGKSLHLAALMKNRGKIIALDVEAWKLEELRKRASRAGVDIIETRLIDSSKVIKRLAGSADLVLLDVPCSGLGVLRRNPDTKWKLNEDRLEHMIQLQREILDQYSRMVAPGGRLVYATCSLLPSENIAQTQNFSDHHPWSVDETRTFLPGKTVGDGFFMARLRRST